MSNIAFLAGDIVIYWSQIILVLGLIAGCMFAFVLRPFTKVKKKAMVLWMILTFVFSVLFSKALYYYCVPEQFISIQDALWGLLDEKHCIVGVVPGALFASLIVKITGWERKI